MLYKSSASLAVLSLMLVGCGGSVSRPPSTKPVRVFVAWDGSGFSRFAGSYEQEIIAVIQRLAASHDEVFDAVLDGQPLTTARIAKKDFSAHAGEGEEGDVEETRLVNRSVATGFAKELVESQREVVAGSGQLQGLLLAARIPGVSQILMWTDAVVNEPANHFSLTGASDSEIESEIRYWRPRLRALRGKEVVMIGVGHGVQAVSTVEHAKRLFEAVVEGNGGRLGWMTSWAQS